MDINKLISILADGPEYLECLSPDQLNQLIRMVNYSLAMDPLYQDYYAQLMEARELLLRERSIRILPDEIQIKITEVFTNN